MRKVLGRPLIWVRPQSKVAEAEVIKSVLSGMVWGTVFSVLGLAAIAVVTPLPRGDVRDALMPAPSTRTVEPVPGLTREDVMPALPRTDTRPEDTALAEQILQPDPAPEVTAPVSAPDSAPPTPPESAPPPTPEGPAPEIAAPADAAPLQPVTAPETQAQPEVAAEPQQTPEPAQMPQSAPEAEAPSDPETTATAEPPAPPRPQPGLKAEVEGVRTGRLPTIGATPTPESPEPELPAIELAETAPALVRNVRAFANPENRPLMVVLLRDDPAFDGDLSALAGGDLPLTLVIDPADATSAARGAQWRQFGQEVALTTDALPSSAEGSDHEVTLESLDTGFGVALAFVADDAGAFQGDRARALAAAPAMAARGYGLVTWDRGVNPADQAARRAGVAAARIFREIDAENDPAPAVRRQLDRAVFKAAQDGQVVVMGRLRPETLAALADWAASARAAQVAAAPLSALLQAE